MRRVLDVISQATAAITPSESIPALADSSSPYAESRCPGAVLPPAVFSQFQGFRSVPRRGKWRELDYTGITFPAFPAGGGYILTGKTGCNLQASKDTAWRVPSSLFFFSILYVV